MNLLHLVAFKSSFFGRFTAGLPEIVFTIRKCELNIHSINKVITLSSFITITFDNNIKFVQW